jgi:molecular chaperone DnaK
LTFDDVTAVAPSPDAAAAALDQEARQPRQGTLPGTGETDPLFDGYEYEEVEDEEVTDGSVTFDLASLGLEDGEPDSLADIDEETTQIYDSKKSKDLPTTPSSTMEEIGDSALFSLDESDGTEEADLPSPASKRSEERPTDSVLTALQAETDLPTVSADQGLSTTKAGLPAPVSPRSGFGDGDELEDTEVGHRSPHENLPLRADRNQNLPSPLASNLPEKRKGARTNLGPLVAKPSTPPASRPPAELDFDGAIQNSPPAAPGIEELDELSVAALLPDDDSDDQIAVTVDPDEAEIPMSGGGPSFSPGAFLRQSGAAPAAEAPRQVPPPGSSPTPGTSSPPPSAGQRRGAPLLLDVTPLSLGVEVSGGYVDQLIARNSPIPCESTRTFATTRDNQPLVRVRVSQGEEDRFNRNTLLGELELTGLSQGPRGTVKVDVSFALDESGMLQVTARDVASGNAANARLTLVGLGENIERGA